MDITFCVYLPNKHTFVAPTFYEFVEKVVKVRLSADLVACLME